MPKIRRELTEAVTVKLGRQQLQRLDRMAVQLSRSRADMIRRLITTAQLTGLADVVALTDDQGGSDAA